MTVASFFYIVVIVGGIAFTLFSVSQNGDNTKAWMRKGLLLCGIFATIWGIISLALGQFPSVIPNRALVSATNLKSGFGGAFVGLMLYLMLFKEFWKQPARQAEG
jgi:hypothetical protein